MSEIGSQREVAESHVVRDDIPNPRTQERLREVDRIAVFNTSHLCDVRGSCRNCRRVRSVAREINFGNKACYEVRRGAAGDLFACLRGGDEIPRFWRAGRSPVPVSVEHKASSGYPLLVARMRHVIARVPLLVHRRPKVEDDIGVEIDVVINGKFGHCSTVRWQNVVSGNEPQKFTERSRTLAGTSHKSSGLNRLIGLGATTSIVPAAT
jgi:hypothetical protein